MIPALLLIVLAQTPPQTWAKPGGDAPYVQAIQGVTGMTPIAISGSVSSSGAGDTVGADGTFNANSVCATVATAGQTGAGFFLASGTLAATLTPSVSTDTSASCSGGTWTATSFVDISGNTSATLVLTNPNSAQAYGLKLMAGGRCARVCTTSYTSGSAVGHLVASTPQPPPPAAGADVTDRVGRLLGELTDGSSAYTATKTGQLPTALDGSGFLKTHEQGTATVTGTVTVSGTVAATQSGSWSLAANQSVNTAQVNGATVSTAASGIQKVGVSGSTGAALDAAGQNGSSPANEVIVGGQFNTSPTTITSGNVSPIQLNSSGSVKVDGSATTQPISGTVTANAGSGNFAENLAQVNGSTVSTAATGVQKVGVSGASGATMDAAGQNVASPANELLVGAQFNTSPTTITTGNMSPLQVDSTGSLKVNVVAGGGGGGPSDVASSSAASESDTARQKVTSAIRLYDTGQGAGSQLVTAKGDQTSGMWVNCKAGCSAAGDTTGSQVTLNASNAAASVAMAGENSIAVQLTSSTSPVLTIVGECSLDAGSTYGNTLTFSSSTSTTATSLANPANGTYALILPPGCSGATNVRVRVSAYTSGSVVAQVRATSNSPAASPYVAVVGTTSYPPAGVAMLAQDSSTTTTSRAVRASANGILVDGSGVTQPVSGTVSTTPPSNASTNVAQLAGTTTDTNSGNKSAGTLRVVIATDQPALTNKLLVTPDSVALPANQSVNVAQINGVTTTMGNGVSGTGVQRVTIASDSTGKIAAWDGTNTVTVKAASTAPATTDTALVVTESPQVADQCTNTLAISQTTSTDILTTTNKLHICSLVLVASAALTVNLIEGTGTTCATGGAALIGSTTAANGLSLAANGGFSAIAGRPWLKSKTTADHICLTMSGTGTVAGVMTYADQ